MLIMLCFTIYYIRASEDRKKALRWVLVILWVMTFMLSSWVYLVVLVLLIFIVHFFTQAMYA